MSPLFSFLQFPGFIGRVDEWQVFFENFLERYGAQEAATRRVVIRLGALISCAFGDLLAIVLRARRSTFS
jgi:hypothetical protein